MYFKIQSISKLHFIFTLFLENEKNAFNTTTGLSNADKNGKKLLGASLATANSADEVQHYLVLAIVVTVISVCV